MLDEGKDNARVGNKFQDVGKVLEYMRDLEQSLQKKISFINLFRAITIPTTAKLFILRTFSNNSLIIILIEVYYTYNKTTHVDNTYRRIKHLY